MARRQCTVAHARNHLTVLEVIPYGKHEIDEADIAAVAETLRSAWLTTGPLVEKFERAFAEYCDVTEAVAVNSGTAALHAAAHVLDLGPGDEVIVPAVTFAATANAVVYEGGTPVFADVEPDTLLIDAASVEARITPRTKAIFAVDYAGQPADYDALRRLAEKHNLALVADACHAPGATYYNQKVGQVADLSTFSFHPVKHFTTCEGGMITTMSPERATRMRRFRNHGIDSDHRSRNSSGTFAYDMIDLGYNYRLPDVQCALGLSQLRRMPERVAKRQQIAAHYDQVFSRMSHVRPLTTRAGRTNAYHLYVVLLNLDQLRVDRKAAFEHLRRAGIGVNVHYAPVYHHSFYREKFGYGPELCPVAEAVYERILSLPMFPGLTPDDMDRVTAAIEDLKEVH
jgi:perosamine synthetase